jgi:hypothetical protein
METPTMGKVIVTATIENLQDLFHRVVLMVEPNGE